MAIKTNMIMDQGATFSALLTIRNSQGQTFDLTGSTVSASFKKSYAADTRVNLGANIVSAVLGQVLLTASSEETAEFEPGRYVYDVIIEIDSRKYRAVEGQLTITPGVTL